MSTRQHLVPKVRVARSSVSAGGLVLASVALIALLLAGKAVPDRGAAEAAGAVGAAEPTTTDARPVLGAAPAVATPADGEETIVNAMPLTSVEDPELSIIRRMSDEFGTKCFSSGDVVIARPRDLPERLDRQLRAANLTSEGWLPADKADWFFSFPKSIWVGTALGAADEFGASAAYAHEDSVWLYIVADGRPKGVQLLRFSSASGVVVWAVGSGVGPSDCAVRDE